MQSSSNGFGAFCSTIIDTILYLKKKKKPPLPSLFLKEKNIEYVSMLLE